MAQQLKSTHMSSFLGSDCFPYFSCVLYYTNFSPLQIKLYVAQISRILEMVGYAMSLVVLVFALATFCYFR